MIHRDCGAGIRAAADRRAEKYGSPRPPAALETFEYELRLDRQADLPATTFRS